MASSLVTDVHYFPATFSDVIVHYGTTTFHAHAVPLCAHSKFFKVALEGLRGSNVECKTCGRVDQCITMDSIAGVSADDVDVVFQCFYEPQRMSTMPYVPQTVESHDFWAQYSGLRPSRELYPNAVLVFSHLSCFDWLRRCADNIIHHGHPSYDMTEEARVAAAKLPKVVDWMVQRLSEEFTDYMHELASLGFVSARLIRNLPTEHKTQIEDAFRTSIQAGDANIWKTAWRRAKAIELAKNAADAKWLVPIHNLTRLSNFALRVALTERGFDLSRLPRNTRDEMLSALVDFVPQRKRRRSENDLSCSTTDDGMVRWDWIRKIAKLAPPEDV